jgi:hypothetical protein
MELKPFYSYDEVARLEQRSIQTITTWVSRDFKLPAEHRRFPGAYGGLVPLADLKARYGLTNEEIRLIDLPEPVPPRVTA